MEDKDYAFLLVFVVLVVYELQFHNFQEEMVEMDATGFKERRFKKEELFFETY